MWNTKHQNKFQFADIQILDGNHFTDQTEEGRQQLADFVVHGIDVPLYSGDVVIEQGLIQSEVSVMHARSLAEDVIVNVITSYSIHYTKLYDPSLGTIRSGQSS